MSAVSQESQLRSSSGSQRTLMARTRSPGMTNCGPSWPVCWTQMKTTSSSSLSKMSQILKRKRKWWTSCMQPMDLPGTDRHGLMVWCGATKIRLVHFQWAGTGQAVVKRSYHQVNKYGGSMHFMLNRLFTYFAFGHLSEKVTQHLLSCSTA